MIKKLHIERFKSIKSLSLDCRKVNLFIGEPDTGKTNILEALSFLSHLGWGEAIGYYLRLTQNQGFDPLFHGQFFDRPITIDTDDARVSVSIEGQDRHLRIECAPENSSHKVSFNGAAPPLGHLQSVRCYSYTSSLDWGYSATGPDPHNVLVPPRGANLMYLARHNSKVNDFLKETLADLDWKPRFDPNQNQKRYVLTENRGDEFFDYPLEMLSDSLKRFFFYGAILVTSKDAVLILDEPDVYAFPPYPKLLGEMIATDDTNQFFLTTHNPYFLHGIVQKAPVDSLALFVCYRHPDGGSAVRQLTTAEIQKVIEQGSSVFFNLDAFVKP